MAYKIFTENRNKHMQTLKSGHNEITTLGSLICF